MFGHPKAFVAVLLSRLGQQRRIGQSLPDSATFAHRNQIEDGKLDHA